MRYRIEKPEIYLNLNFKQLFEMHSQLGTYKDTEEGAIDQKIASSIANKSRKWLHLTLTMRKRSTPTNRARARGNTGSSLFQIFRT